MAAPTASEQGRSTGGLDAALDTIADRCGRDTLVRGTLLRHGTGREMPTLPDRAPEDE